MITKLFSPYFEREMLLAKNNKDNLLNKNKERLAPGLNYYEESINVCQ